MLETYVLTKEEGLCISHVTISNYFQGTRIKTLRCNCTRQFSMFYIIKIKSSCKSHLIEFIMRSLLVFPQNLITTAALQPYSVYMFS